jgi:putative ABC transport system substrate-binding protein
LIGFSQSDPGAALRIANFEQGLRELGWIKGRNIQIHYRLAAEQEVLQAHARDLMALQPDLIVASSTFVVSALLQEACTLPIVFVSAVDPVARGFVNALQRPGGNLTGFTNSIPSMGGKWLELLKEVAPSVARVSIMFNPDRAPRSLSFFFPQVETVASSVAVELAAAPVRSPAEIKSVLADIGRDEAQGLVIIPDNFTSVHRALIIEQAARLKMPAIYPFRYFATDGGLVACGPDMLDLYRRTSVYVDRILRGGKPADLPVQEPSKVDLVVNLRTAEALGLSVPRIVIARASEVIE